MKKLSARLKKAKKVIKRKRKRKKEKETHGQNERQIEKMNYLSV